MFKTVKGTWYHPNRFYTDENKLIYVFPFGVTIDIIRTQLPLHCYILLRGRNVVVDWVEC